MSEYVDMDEITIGYLSWKRHDILRQTLESHKRNGLFELIPPANRMIFFQEISEVDRAIADEYGLQVRGSENNIGTAGGFEELVRRCKTAHFLFCENDWMLIEDKGVCTEILGDCLTLLEQEESRLVRLRHKRKPGVPLYSRPSDVGEWMRGGPDGCRYKLESLSWVDDPCGCYAPGTLVEHQGNHKWYMTTLHHQSWSNNVFIANTQWLKNVIVPLLSSSSGHDKYTGLEDVLINFERHVGQRADLDRLIENYKRVHLVAGDGLFTHQDRLI